VKYLISLMLLIICMNKLFAQSTDEIIQKHIEVIGGERWNSISTFFIEATTNTNQGKVSISKISIKDRAVRNNITIEPLDASRHEKKYYIILDGDKGWQYLPGNNNRPVYTLYKNEVDILRDELDYEDPFLRAVEKEREISLLDIVYEGDEEFYKFMVDFKSGKRQFCYINTQTLMIDKIETVGLEGEVRYSNYEPTPEGIMIARKTINNVGTVKIVAVKINLPVNAAIFQPTETDNQHFVR